MVQVVHNTDLDEVTITENAGHKLEVIPAGVIAAINTQLQADPTLLGLEEMQDASGDCIGFAFPCETVAPPANTAPTIALNGNASESLIVGDTFTDAGATATDAEDGALTPVVTGTVDTAVAGVYVLTYTATDSQGATATAIRTVTVVANSMPTITLLGNAAESLTVGDTFVDAGATAADTEDGDLTASIVVGGDTVDVNTAGVYTITYTVTDSHGGTATADRVVTVSDNAFPTITLLGNAAETIAQGDIYTDPGSTATDAEDGDLTASITILGGVVPSTPGTYTLTHTVTDSFGQTATATRTVTVTADVIPPTIAIPVSAVTIVECDAYVPQVATANDNLHGDISGDVVVDQSALDVTTAGTYNVVHNVSDAEGNAATPAIETVTVTPYVFAPDQTGTMPAGTQAFDSAGLNHYTWFDMTVPKDGTYDLTAPVGDWVSSGFGPILSGVTDAEVHVNGTEVATFPFTELTGSGFFPSLSGYSAVNVPNIALSAGDVVSIHGLRPVTATGPNFALAADYTMTLTEQKPC